METQPLWISHPRAVFDPQAEAEDDTGGGIVIEGNRIVERVPRGGSPVRPHCQTFDASDCVLLPGLINTHHHFYQTLTRAHPAGLNRPLFNWLKGLYPIWRYLDAELIRVSTQLACAELLLSGCTTTVDHHYVFSETLTDAIDIQATTCRELGIRSVLTRGSMSLGEREGGLPPQSIVQTDEKILADSERLISVWHDTADDAMTQVALAPCSPFSVTPELLKATAQLAREHHVGLHTHLAETQDENDFCLEQFGQRPLDHLENCGWLQPGTWFAHGIHFEPSEISRLGAAQVGIAHCPSSNMMLGSGIARVPELVAAGVRVGLGVDGSASNDHSNLIQEVRECALLQRLRDGLAGPEHLPQDSLFSPEDALKIATHGGAELLGRPTLGSLGIDSVADLALYRLDEPRFSGVHDPIAGLVLGGAHRASHVMVNGLWRVRDATLVDFDIDSLIAQHQSAARRLWQRN